MHTVFVHSFSLALSHRDFQGFLHDKSNSTQQIVSDTPLEPFDVIQQLLKIGEKYVLIS